MTIPTYTQFCAKEFIAKQTLPVVSMEETEAEEMEFAIQTVPVKEYSMKVNIVSVEKGTPKFHPFNDL
ncbi:MAG: hypothetical protein KKD31_16080 [Bacteroidetes bacterium]|nr:hypothetical protein [Bacteroidota bacterium]